MAAVAHRKSTNAKNDSYFLREVVAKNITSWYISTLEQHNIHPTRREDPCAGLGAMATYFTQIDQFDLDPRGAPSIKTRDFLTHTQPYEPGLCYVMNVPYGQNSSCAIEFFNIAAEFGDTICIIVPVSWSGKYAARIINQLDRNFVLIGEQKLPHNSFYLPDNNNKIHNVPSVAQIWGRSSTLRPLMATQITSSAFTVVGNKSSRITPDFAIRRELGVTLERS